MSTIAVTPAAPAAANTSKGTEHSNFLSTDKHYRLTGEKPADTEETPAVSTEDISPTTRADEHTPAAEETAAASETATQQEKPVKTSATSESRWAKLSRENRELREKVDRIERERQASPTQQRDSQPTTQPAAETKPQANAKPKIDDVDPKTGKPKYGSYAEYEDAKDEWLRNDTLRQFQETSAKTESERAAQATQDRELSERMKKLEPAMKKYGEEEFKRVAGNREIILPRGSVTDLFLADSDQAGEVLYHLGKHPEILEGFYENYDPNTGKFTNKITPQQQFRKLMEIEAQFTGSARREAPVKPVTQAPTPPRQTSGTGSVTKDAVERAVEESDTETYIREQNARALARRKQGK